MSSGVKRVVTGGVTGTGAVLSVATIGFRPQKMELINVDGLAKADWNDVMADDSMLKTVTAGTMSLVTTGGITPTSRGFDLGADADLNVAGEQLLWVAFE